MPVHQRRLITRVAAGATVALWLSTIVLLIVLLIVRPHGLGPFVLVEMWLLGAALGATIAKSSLRESDSEAERAAERSLNFEHGYLCAAADLREQRVVSIASPRRGGTSVNGVPRKSNKVS